MTDPVKCNWGDGAQLEVDYGDDEVLLHASCPARLGKTSVRLELCRKSTEELIRQLSDALAKIED